MKRKHLLAVACWDLEIALFTPARLPARDVAHNGGFIYPWPLMTTGQTRRYEDFQSVGLHRDYIKPPIIVGDE